MIFTKYPNDVWHKRKIDNFDPYNVFLAIATNIPVLLKTGFVLQGHIYEWYSGNWQHKLQYRSYTIYFLPYFVIKMENVFVVYIYWLYNHNHKIDISKIFIKNIILDKLLVIVQQCILFLSQLNVRDYFFCQLYIHK